MVSLMQYLRGKGYSLTMPGIILASPYNHVVSVQSSGLVQIPTGQNFQDQSTLDSWRVVSPG